MFIEGSVIFVKSSDSSIILYLIGMGFSITLSTQVWISPFLAGSPPM